MIFSNVQVILLSYIDIVFIFNFHLLNYISLNIDLLELKSNNIWMEFFLCSIVDKNIFLLGFDDHDEFIKFQYKLN